ncbi:MAG: hypothetical protein ABJO67_07325 [Pseudoruegeria sp.]
MRFHLEGYACDLIIRDPSQLIVTFDFMQGPQAAPARDRVGWGHLFLEKLNLSALHVKPDINCWYRKPGVARFLETAQHAGLFSAFSLVMTYGGSMGGFAAMSFAEVTQARRCLVLNPQSSLGPSTQSWDKRFPEAWAQNWGGPYCDLAARTKNLERLVAVYDPYMTADRAQADGITHPRLSRLHLPFVGHSIGSHLQSMGALYAVFQQCLTGDIDTQDFYRRARQRRRLKRYKNIMTKRAVDRGCSQEKIKRLDALLPKPSIGT